MILACDDNDDGCDDGGDQERDVNLDVGEEDKPLVAATRFEFASGLSTAYRASWVLAADA